MNIVNIHIIAGKIAAGIVLLTIGAAGAAQDSRPASNPIVLEVAGERATAADAFDSLLFHFRDDAVEVLRKLAGDAIIRAEAARLGVTVENEDFEPAVREAIATLQKRVETEYGSSLTLDEFLQEEMFTSRAEYEHSVRAFARQSRLCAFVIRYDQMTNDRATVRHLLLRDRKKAEQCLQKLREGADFAALARDESLAATKNDGGKIPPFDREFPHAITSTAFTTPPGTLAGPIEEKRGEIVNFHIIKVLDLKKGRALSFGDAREEIVNSLRDSPLSRFEFEAFMRKAGKRYSARVLNRPLLADSPERAASAPATR